MADAEVRVGKNLNSWTQEELDVVCVKCGDRFGRHVCMPPHKNVTTNNSKKCDAFEQDLFDLLVQQALNGVE